MSFAPLTSPRPPMRSEGAPVPDGWAFLNWATSGTLQDTLSAQALVLLTWILILTPLVWWLRRRAGPDGMTMPGRWRLYRPGAASAHSGACSWRRGSTRLASGMQKWQCDTCGRDGFSSTNDPPDGCNFK